AAALVPGVETCALPVGVGTLAGPTGSLAAGYDGAFGDGNGRRIDYSAIEKFNITGSSFGDNFTTGDGDDQFTLNGGDDLVNAKADRKSVVEGKGVDQVR